MKETKLTSVKIIDDLYKNFKSKVVQNGFNLQKLVNRSIYLYNKDEKFEESLIFYEKLAGMDPGNQKIIAGLLRCLIQLKRIEDANEMFESLDEKILESDEILKIKKLLNNSNIKNTGISCEKLAEELKMKPNDKDLRFKLAECYLSSSETKKGFDELLNLFAQDSKWNEHAAKKKLLEYFDLLGYNDPNVIEARKKLSSIMFK